MLKLHHPLESSERSGRLHAQAVPLVNYIRILGDGPQDSTGVELPSGIHKHPWLGTTGQEDTLRFENWGKGVSQPMHCLLPQREACWSIVGGSLDTPSSLGPHPLERWPCVSLSHLPVSVFHSPQMIFLGFDANTVKLLPSAADQAQAMETLQRIPVLFLLAQFPPPALHSGQMGGSTLVFLHPLTTPRAGYSRVICV